ncbi:EcsC family protein [Qipengyuania sp. JC766]|uniref:EcsC family protein n=1 Tax=Qipengyuania sp. JC766 TaxID=3232139 RepID=UPI00345ABEB7
MDFRKDQQRYRRSKPSMLGRGIERLTNPVGGALASLVPRKLVEGVVKGIDRAVGAPKFVTFAHDPQDMEAARDAARKVERVARSVNAGTGAASGFGGALTMSADVPATIAIAMRNIRDTGRAYGFDGEGPQERLFRLQILELAALNDQDVRQERIAALEAAIADDGSLTALKGKAIEPLVDQAVERISRALAFASVRGRAGMVVPIVGAAVGAFVNNSFQSDVSKAARFAFQARRLKAAGTGSDG